MPSPTSLSSLYQRLYVALLVAAMLVVFLADSLTPLGFAHGTLYAPVLILAALTQRIPLVIASTIIAGLLTVAGIFLSPAGAEPVIHLSNRLFSIVTIALTAGVCVLALKAMRGGSAVHERLTQSLDQLEQQQQRIRQLADAMPLIVWTASPDGRLDYTNALFNTVTGFDANVFIDNQRWSEICHPNDISGYIAAWSHAVDTGEDFEHEFRLRRHDGEYRWHLSRAVAARSDQGNITRWYGTALDIHERKALEQETRHSEERFRYLSKATSDAVWDWDAVNRTLWWSEGMKALCGIEDDTVINSIDFWKEHIHPEDREDVVASFRAALHGNDSEWRRRYRFLRDDGSVAIVDDIGFVLRDNNGKAIRMVGGMKDITAELSLQDQLHQSERLRAIGELTGGVAHDFNNLLTVIIGNSELLRDQLQDDYRLDGLAGMITSAASRGAELTRRLLAFARRQPLEPVPLDLKRQLDQLEPLIRRTLPASIDLSIIHAAGLWQAMADSAQLESALLNLCLNARDAMTDGGRLTIETANMHLDHDYCEQHGEVTPGRYVMIAVSDSGHGMDADTLDRAFDPFFSTKTKSEGSGLGLSMVYGFAKQSNGHVRIYSEPNEGTTVRLYLPRTTEQAVAASPPESPSTRALPGGTETILVVEDDELVRIAVCGQLSRLGYQTLEAADAERAMEIINNNSGIDLLFTDVVLPGQFNGRMLADRILTNNPKMKVLFTSGYTENAIVHHGRLDEGVQLLSKPYRQEELARRVRQVLDHNKAST